MTKSETERRQIALVASVSLTLLIVFIWLANGFIINKISQEKELQVTAVIRQDSEPSFLEREVGRVVDGFEVMGNYVKGLF